MFSRDDRCYYMNNQLGDVICQLRFPEILSIGAQPPVAFQEAIRDEYPQYSALKETPAPRLTGAPGNFAVENQPTTINYQFLSEDGAWRINLTSKFISLACNRYTSWEDFARKLDKPLAAFIKIYKPANFERIGLRYVNLLAREAVDVADVSFRDLLNPCWIGPFAEDDVQEASVTRYTADSEINIRGGCRAKIHTGPVLVTRGGKTDPAPKFAFDQDLYMTGNIPITYSAGSLETLHSQAFSIFRGAITDTLHNAMEPQSI